MADGPPTEHPLVVVAIDFGTTFTGFAFSINESCKEIITPTSETKERVPITVLLNKDKVFDCLGYKAENKYANLTEEDKHYNWFYVKNFKTKLYLTKPLTRDATLLDSQGRLLSAMSIFQMVIEHFKEQAENCIKQSMSGIQDCYIKWIITVPAIWCDSAKQFMREAATRAGIDDSRLSLVLEPEAASLYCKEQPLCAVVKLDGHVQSEKLPEGHKYILADLGGGTADICVHEILDGGNLREIHRSDGGAFGGTNVDLAFHDMIIKLIGEPAWMRFKKEEMEDYLELMKNFETKKKEFRKETQSEDSKITLTIPVGLLEKVKDEHLLSLAEIIPNTVYSNCLQFTKRNKLILEASVMEDFFQPTVDSIVKCLTHIIQDINESDSNIGTLLLVGGFSESPYLQESLKEKVKGVRIICPVDGSLAVLKGAVIMGFRPSTIVERRVSHTYGFNESVLFQEGIHPETLMKQQDAETLCSNIFVKIIEKGEIVSSGQIFKHTCPFYCTLKESKHNIAMTRIYKSTNNNPKYCTDEGCVLVGKIHHFPPEEGWADVVEMEYNILVAGTEFKLTVFDKSTGRKDNAQLDFL